MCISFTIPHTGCQAFNVITICWILGICLSMTLVKFAVGGKTNKLQPCRTINKIVGKNHLY